MHKPQEQVLEFHRRFGSPHNNRPTLLADDDAFLRWHLIYEELNEFLDAILAKDIVGVADSLGDLEYVVNGAAVAYGIDLEPIFDEIHRSNMDKLGPDGKVRKREDGKILKPKDWKPPQLEPILEKQGATVATE